MPGRVTTEEARADAPPADEPALVAAALRDPRAFAPLYLRYVGPVYRYCRARLGTKEAAEDATSLVFAKALSALPTRHPAGSFRAWLFAIAYNTVADAHRARRPDDDLTEADDLPDAAPSPEDEAVAADQRRSLHALLARLPPDQRRILELRLAGLTGPEIAQILGRSPGAVKIAQVRAYARLRDLLGIASPTADRSLLGAAPRPKEDARGAR